MLKYIAIHIVRFLLTVFYIFPVNKNKIFFSSHEGNRFFCNPKYIFINLYDKLPELKYIWCLNNDKSELSEYPNVIVVKRDTLLWVYHILTAKVIITNQYLRNILPYRKNQIIINTWHGGGAYKKVGFAETSNRSKKYWLKKIKNKFFTLSTQHISYFISSSKVFSDVMHESYLIPYDKYLPIGMPRNDIFFRDNSEFIPILKKKLNVPSDAGIVLYAPTHRGGMEYTLDEMNKSVTNLHIAELKNALKEKFKKEFIYMFRGHPNYKNKLHCDDAIDISSYNDMQELLVISDVLITDYSSSIWDFSLTSKPCFLFVPDLDLYLLQDKGLYTSIDTWPFPLAGTNEELCDNIFKFDKSMYDKKVKKHHKDLGSYERGTAASKVTEMLQEIFE